MAFFLLYQILPCALLGALCLAGGRREAFRRFGVPAVFVLGSALQLALWAAGHPALEGPDSRGFWALSRGEGVDLRTALYRPRLYPWFLSLFPSLEAATLVQCLLKLAAGGMLVRLARRLGCGPGARAFALALFLLNAHWLREPLAILDTTLFTFLFTAALVLAVETALEFSPGRYLALCAACGLASLGRQTGDIALAALLASAVALPLARASGRLGPGPAGIPAPRPSAILLVGGLLLAAVLAHLGALANGLQHGAWKRSVALGVNLYTHASYYALADSASPEWDFVEARLPGARIRLGPWDPHWRSPVPWPVNALPHDLERALGSATLPDILAADALLARRFRAWAGEDPARYLASAGNEAGRLLWKSEEYHPATVLGLGGEAPAWARRMERGLIHQPVGLLMLLAGLAVFFGRKSAWLPGLVVVCYLGPLPFVQIGFARYALPVVPVLLVLAAAGIEAAGSAIRMKNEK